MEVSVKLANEFNTIILSHMITLSLLTVFTSYIYFRAKKTPLLYSYLSVVGMTSLWMIAKIFKTLSPNIELRWFFILVQYFAIDFLGVALILFGYIYRKNKIPSKKLLLSVSILPTFSFIAILTNPLHMRFYSYFDIYRDRFGSMFYLAQSVHYLYLILGILMLTQGFTKQPIFKGKKSFGNLFSLLVLIPVFANLYYILFKMDIFEWIFPFPIFDFSPIAASISLVLFTIPSLSYRFFDMSPISLAKLYDVVPEGIVFVDTKGQLFGANKTFYNLFSLNNKVEKLSDFIATSNDFKSVDANDVHNFIFNSDESIIEFVTHTQRHIQIAKTQIRKNHFLLTINDTTDLTKNKLLLLEQNDELEKINLRLEQMTKDAKALHLARSKSKIAQNIHDILGHSLTVVIVSSELAISDTPQGAKEKALQIEELLTGSLNDLRNTFISDTYTWGQTTLTKILNHLKNEHLEVEIIVNGDPYEINGEKTEAIYRMCQEAITNAIKHGQAKNIYLLLKYSPQEIEIYTIDNGKGCNQITKNYGLNGIEKRFSNLNGFTEFASDGESGFTIHARIPKQ